MNKKIQDYLHFYLGCEVEPNYNRRRKLVGFLYNESENTKPMLLDFSETYSRIGQPYAVNYSDVKPILRPLGSMTEEEYAESAMIIFKKDGIKNNEAASIIGESIIKYGTKPDNIYGCFNLTMHLLSRHFDLFGLIDAGLAIDKTSTK